MAGGIGHGLGAGSVHGGPGIGPGVGSVGGIGIGGVPGPGNGPVPGGGSVGMVGGVGGMNAGMGGAGGVGGVGSMGGWAGPAKLEAQLTCCAFSLSRRTRALLFAFAGHQHLLHQLHQGSPRPARPCFAHAWRVCTSSLDVE